MENRKVTEFASQGSPEKQNQLFVCLKELGHETIEADKSRDLRDESASWVESSWYFPLRHWQAGDPGKADISGRLQR